MRSGPQLALLAPRVCVAQRCHRWPRARAWRSVRLTFTWRPPQDSPHLDQFVIHAALDMVEELVWTTSSRPAVASRSPRDNSYSLWR